MSEGTNLARFSEAVRKSTVKRLASIPDGRENWRHLSYTLSFAEMAQHIINMDNWLFNFLDGELPSRPTARVGTRTVADRAEYAAMLSEMERNQCRRQKLMASLTDRVLSMPVYFEDRDAVMPLQTLVVADYLQHEIRQWERMTAARKALDKELTPVSA